MNWLQELPPILFMVLGGLFTWLIKSKIEELRAIQTILREERRKIYSQILEPFALIASDPKGGGAAKAIKKFTSDDYSRAKFDFFLFGSDKVIRAYNAIMTHVFIAESTGNRNTKQMIKLWSDLLLEVRKSLGNKKTKLDAKEMLRGVVKDIDDILK